MFKKALFLIALFMGYISIVNANSLVTGTDGFDLLEYNVVEGNKIELIFSQALIEEPMNVELFDSNGNLLFIDSIDYLSGRTIAVINVGEPLVANSNYKINILSVFGTSGFIVQDDDEFIDIVVDGSFQSQTETNTQISAEDLFNQKSTQNDTITHNAAEQEPENSDIFGEDAIIDNDIFLDDTITQIDNNSEQVNSNSSNILDTSTSNSNINNSVVNNSLNSNINESVDNTNNNAQTGTGSSVITGIPKTGPATNLLLLLLLLSSGVYFIIRKNVIK